MIDKIYLTQQGRRLLALGQTGTNVHFTRVQMGDGFLPQGQNITQLKALVHPIRYIPIAGLISSGVTASVSAQICNADQTVGCWFREIGLWANDPDFGEILYAVGNGGDKADWIPPPDVMRIDYTFALELTIDNAENMSIEYQPSLVFATKEELAGYQKKIAKANGVLSKDNWQGSAAPYTQEVAVTGLLDADEPIIELVVRDLKEERHGRTSGAGHASERHDLRHQSPRAASIKSRRGRHRNVQRRYLSQRPNV